MWLDDGGRWQPIRLPVGLPRDPRPAGLSRAAEAAAIGGDVGMLRSAAIWTPAGMPRTSSVPSAGSTENMAFRDRAPEWGLQAAYHCGICGSGKTACIGVAVAASSSLPGRMRPRTVSEP